MLAWVPVIITIVIVPFNLLKSEDTHTGVSQTLGSEQSSQEYDNSQDSTLYFVSAEHQGNNGELHVVRPDKDFCDHNKKPYRWEPLQCAYKGAVARIRNIQLDSSLFDDVSCTKVGKLKGSDGGGVYEVDCSVVPFQKKTLSLSCLYDVHKFEVRLKDNFFSRAGACQAMCDFNSECISGGPSRSECPTLEKRKRIQVSEVGKRFKALDAGDHDYCNREKKAERIRACTRVYVNLNQKLYCPDYKDKVHRLAKNGLSYYGVGCCAAD